MPGKHSHYFALALGLAALLLGFLIWDNAAYLFHARLYEAGDPGANSLSVLRAEHFQELYGAYSRWSFHHPGPALFYSFALGEKLLYGGFHVVPTAYNAQVMVVMILTASFFAGGIGAAARWVRGPVFVPLALLLAALHFMSVNPKYCLLNSWPPFTLPMIFFALLMAGASVGAGAGADLPLLVLAGGFAVHSHIVQPLFVGPVAALGYLGLAWTCYHSRREAVRVAEIMPGTVPPPAAPWRVFPWAHRLAAGILAAFVLPMVVDLFFGTQSNLAHVLDHMRTYHGERKPWLDAVYCFVRFSTYKPSRTDNQISPGHATWGQIGHYGLGHPEMTLLWLCAVVVPVVAFVGHRRRLRQIEVANGMVMETPAAIVAVNPLPRGRWRFLGWLAFMVMLTAGLTIVWGHLQDGEMFYYNSWFTYSIYYALAVLAAGGVAEIVENRAARTRLPGVWSGLAAALCLLAAGGAVMRHLGHFRTNEYDQESYRAASRTVDAALAAHPDAPPAKLLVFPHDGWGAASAIAAKLARAGREVIVPPDWYFMFGDGHVPADTFTRLAAAKGKPPYDIWHIVSAPDAGPELTARCPLADGYVLQAGGVALDPARSDAAVTFVGPHPDADFFVLTGWATADAGAAYTYSLGKQGILNFAPVPVPPDAAVEVEFHFLFARTIPGKRDAQRLTLDFNGHDLGTLRMDATGPKPLTVTIPAAVWNERASALFTLGFPDAISPLEAGESADFRPLAFATDKITFRVVGAAAMATGP